MDNFLSNKSDHILQYMEMIRKTEARDFNNLRSRLSEDKNIRLSHAALGISSELEEVVSCLNSKDVDLVNLMEEMGDICWYIAVAADSLGIDTNRLFRSQDTIHNRAKYNHSHQKMFSELFANEKHLTPLIKSSGEFSDIVKKSVFYGKRLDNKRAQCVLQELVVAVMDILNMAGYLLEEAMEKNREKLLSRYSGGFSEDKAKNRDLDKERGILESD